MNIAHIKSKATAGGQVRGFTLVRRVLACALIGCAAMSAAHAGPGDRAQRYDPQQRQEYSRESEQRQPQRQYDDRQQRQNEERAFQARAEEQRRQMEQQQGNEGRRSGRMTADERRDLRRQINEAGADIYPNQGRRR